MNKTAFQPSETQMNAEKHLLVDGQWVAGNGARLAVLDKYRLQPGAYVTTADPEQVEHAVACAHDAFRRGAPSPFERGAVLERAAALLEARQDDFVRTMQMEAGFTVQDAGGEVQRIDRRLGAGLVRGRFLSGALRAEQSLD